MFKSSRLRQILTYALISFFIMSSCTSLIAAQTEPPSKIEEKLAGISQEEKKLLQSLFVLTQEIEVLESEEEQLALEIEAVLQDTKKLEAEIVEEETKYRKNQEALERFFKTYQRLGPGSYLEIIMNSENLSTLLRRLNTLRDLTRNAGKLLDELAESKAKLSAEKIKKDEKLHSLNDKQVQANEVLIQKLKVKEEKEAYLKALKEESRFYEEQLIYMQKLLDEIKPFLSQAAKELSGIIAEGGISADAMKLSISFFSIKGTIEEEVFNDIISSRTSLKELKFKFHTDRVEINIPEKHLELAGKFVVGEGNILSFQPEEGSFYGMPLEVRYIEELLKESNLILNLEPLLGKNSLQSIKLQEGYIELFVKPSLF